MLLPVARVWGSFFQEQKIEKAMKNNVSIELNKEGHLLELLDKIEKNDEAEDTGWS